MSQTPNPTGPPIEPEDGFDGFKFRVVLLGDAGVGKSSLMRRHVDNAFDEEYKQTIGTTFASKDASISDDDGTSRAVRLMLWDMGGQATYRELRRQYMKGASAAIIVYDVTRPETFMAMNNGYESFREVCPNAEAIICANKTDLADQRMVRPVGLGPEDLHAHHPQVDLPPALLPVKLSAPPLISAPECFLIR